MCGLVFALFPFSIALLALGALAACVMTTLFNVSTHVVLSRRRPWAKVKPGISVLKPLKGIDDDLEANLASIVNQAYDGPFEILLGAADPDDPALVVARRLQRRFPNHAIRIVAGHHESGVNPKVANLAALSAQAHYDAWLISDSNVQVEPDYLASLAAELADPGVGAISNLVVGDGDGDLGAVLENLHLNSFVVGAVCGAEVIAQHPVVIGKSMLVRRSALLRVGGWSRVADFLGEDYVLGAAVHQTGQRVVLSSYRVRTVNRTWTMQRFVSRHLRWAQMRRSIAPAIYLLEPLLNPLPWLVALAGVVSLAGMATPNLLSALAVAAVGKVALDALLLTRLRSHAPTLTEIAAIPLKDAFVLGIWIVGWFRDTVEWRGQRFRIGQGSRLLTETQGAALTPPPPPMAAPWTAHSRPPSPSPRSSLARAPDRH
ncbi:MAG: glycosyltransferase [Myxococcota bacterium]